MSKIDKQCLKNSINALKDRLDALTNGIDLTEYQEQDLYETILIWAEESGSTGRNSAEWSYGNGAVGFIGLKMPNLTDLELVGVSLHADTYAATADLTVTAVDYASTPSGAAPVLGEVELTSSTDGNGTTNNAHKYQPLASPVPVDPLAVLGFRTTTRVGSSGDVRVLAHLRRKIGTALVKI